MNVNSIGVLHKPQTFCGSGNTHPTVSTKLEMQAGDEFVNTAKTVKPISHMASMAHNVIKSVGIGAVALLSLVGCSTKDDPKLSNNLSDTQKLFNSYVSDIMAVEVPEGSMIDSLSLKDSEGDVIGLKYDEGMSKDNMIIFRTTSQHANKAFPTAYGMELFLADTENSGELAALKYTSPISKYDDPNAELQTATKFIKQDGMTIGTEDKINFLSYKYQGGGKSLVKSVEDSKVQGVLTKLFASFKHVK